MDIPFHRIARNAIIFGVVVLIGAEFVFRKRYVEPVREATPLIMEIQQYLELDEVIGFKWNANISAEEGIVFEDGDAVAYPLSTDALGFINSPEAKAAIEAGKRPDIIGVGDSFLEHGAPVLTEFFAEHGLVYRNMAMHRTSPPQFTKVLESYALPLKPKLIVYSIYENDFAETVDYMNWEASGLDWFAFHSGTWCGAPLEAKPLLEGYSGFLSVVRNRIGAGQYLKRGIRGPMVARISQEILDASRISEEQGADFVLLLIPPKEFAAGAVNRDATVYDDTVDDILKKTAGVSAIDLRRIYWKHESPRSLYYRENGHWNEAGIMIAAEEILMLYNESVE